MATMSQAGIYGVGTGILHPKHKNRFRVLFIGMGAAANGSSSVGVPNDLSMQVITATRPQLEFEEVQLDRYNSRAYVAGKHTFSPMSITVEDDVTNRASGAIQAQLERQQRLIGATGPWLNTEATASSYKFGILLENLDGNETVLESWKCEGAYIASVDYGDLDYATGEKMIITLSLRFDNARQILSSDTNGTAIGGLISN
jgi:hypothetical protein